jgi:hypothetical protein
MALMMEKLNNLTASASPPLLPSSPIHLSD